MKDSLYLILALIFVAVIWAVIGVQWNNCSNQGGEYVRGAIWMKCIEKD